MIEDLKKEIVILEQKAATKKVKQSPEVKSVLAAVRALDKALKTTKDKALKKTIEEAKGLLTSYLQLEGVTPPKRRGRRPNSAA
jgi:hypothetical protein